MIFQKAPLYEKTLRLMASKVQLKITKTINHPPLTFAVNHAP